MATVKVVLKNEQERFYKNATAYIGDDLTLRVQRNTDSIAEFQAGYYQYWEYTEELC